MFLRTLALVFMYLVVSPLWNHIVLTNLKKIIRSGVYSVKNVIEPKDLVIQKGDKGNTVVITDCTKYLKGIKYVLLDSSKFM